MLVPVTIKIEGGSSSVTGILDLDVLALDTAAGWCGSYDILAMGEHFDAYVIAQRSVPLPHIPGFPAGRRFTRLPGKWPAPSVYGNIGEAIAALTAVAHLGFDRDGVAHVKSSAVKTPDLLLKVTEPFKNLVRGLTGRPIYFPEWIPCEAKCRKTSKRIGPAVKEGRAQIQAFWNSVPPSERGVGMVCCFVHSPPQSIQVRILL